MSDTTPDFVNGDDNAKAQLAKHGSNIQDAVEEINEYPHSITMSSGPTAFRFFVRRRQLRILSGVIGLKCLRLGGF